MKDWKILINELIESSDFESSKRLLDEFADDTDTDYAWFLLSLIKRNEKIRKQTKIISRKDVNEYEIESESEKEDGNNEEEDKIVKDPQYAMFLENLIEDGKAYKLKISKDDESPRFLVYEKPEESNEHDHDLPIRGYIAMGDDEDNVNSSENRRVKRRVSEEKQDILTTEEISRENKTSGHNAIIEVHQGKPLKYEENVTSSSSDSDMEILDIKDFSEVNNKALVPAKETLKEKLIRILEKPYKNKEYKMLSKYLFEEKPIRRHLDLRERAVSSVLTGMRKSLFDDSPTTFQVIFKKNENDRLKALNLLRMFRFWLVHVPNQDVFKPWEDDEIRKVLPRPRTR